MSDLPGFSDEELAALFHRLFPAGFVGADVLAELAPDGWEHSLLIRAFHPTLEQWHDERVAQHRHLAKLKQLWGNKRKVTDNAETPHPEPTLEDSRREFADKLIDARDECTHVVGAVAWEIFSDNHQVLAADGREVDLGSWRASSSFLSEFADGCDPARSWDDGDEMRFYMGLLWIRGRCDYGTVYRLVFHRLQREGLDWIYTFPRLHVFRFDRDEAESKAPHDYSPSEAFAREQARTAPPPPVVQAYREVFDRRPDGWPP